jgi:hypothetical protein
MKNICLILEILLLTPVIVAQEKRAQLDRPTQSQVSTGDAISGYVLHGKVTDLITDSGIGAATVEVVDSRNNLHTTLTNPDGSYQLDHLPRERSLAARCSQLGYSPNPKVDTAKFKDGMATWNPQLVQENGDAAYLHRTVEHLAALLPNERMVDAKYISVNLPPASRSAVAAELQEQLADPSANNTLNEAVALFKPGPASDKQIRQALDEAVKQIHLQNRAEVKVAGPIGPITIDVLDGHVKLEGVVMSQADKDLLYKSVASVPSPVDIQNNVKVSNKKSTQ